MQRRGFFKSLLGIGVAAKVAPEVLKATEAVPVPAVAPAPVLAPVARVANYAITSSAVPFIWGQADTICIAICKPCVLPPLKRERPIRFAVDSDLDGLRRR